MVNKVEKLKRGRPVILNEHFKTAIRKYNKRGFTAKDILAEIKKDLFQAYQTEHKDWNSVQIKSEIEKTIRWPGINSVQRFLRLEKPENTQDKPCSSDYESPWNIGLATNKKYNFTPESIAVITAVQWWLKHTNQDKIITLRLALWLSRLYNIAKNYADNADIKELRKRHIGKEEFFYRYLTEKAAAYAYYELIWQFSGKALPADTTALDNELVNGSHFLAVNNVKYQGNKIGDNAVIAVTPDRQIKLMAIAKKGR